MGAKRNTGTKNPNAVALGRKGGLKGGAARAAVLSPKERTEIAKAVAAARWDKNLPRATHARVIRIEDIELACANLPDGRRVISDATMMAALGRGYSGYYSQRDAAAGSEHAVRPRYLAPAVLNPFISDKLAHMQPIPYFLRTGKTVAKGGGSAEAVPQICEVWLKARGAGLLNEAQMRTASKAEIIIRGGSGVIPIFRISVVTT